MSIRLDNLADLRASDFLRETVKTVDGGEAADIMTGDGYGFGDKGAKLYGFGGDDTLTGTKNADWLYGGNGNDALHGADGNDQIWGGAGDDKLFGDAGNDFLYAGSGNDQLPGGSGRDTFVIGGSVSVDWVHGTAAFNVETGTKTITDFKVGDDTIRFADFIPHWNLRDARLRQEFVGNWFDEHAHMDGSTLVISGNNNGTASGGEWAIRIENGHSIFDDMHANAAHASSYFSFV